MSRGRRCVMYCGFRFLRDFFTDDEVDELLSKGLVRNVGGYLAIYEASGKERPVQRAAGNERTSEQLRRARSQVMARSSRGPR